MTIIRKNPHWPRGIGVVRSRAAPNPHVLAGDAFSNATSPLTCVQDARVAWCHRGCNAFRTTRSFDLRTMPVGAGLESIANYADAEFPGWMEKNHPNRDAFSAALHVVLPENFPRALFEFAIAWGRTHTAERMALWDVVRTNNAALEAHGALNEAERAQVAVALARSRELFVAADRYTDVAWKIAYSVVEGSALRHALENSNHSLSQCPHPFLGIGRVCEKLLHGEHSRRLQIYADTARVNVRSLLDDGTECGPVDLHDVGDKMDLDEIPLDLEFTSSVDAPIAFIDILANLTSNAEKYGGFKMKVTPHILQNGDLEITVADFGIGMTAETIDRLGEHDFGVDTIIAHLRAQGWGPLWVKSALGVGSTFRFVVPARALMRTGVQVEVVSQPHGGVPVTGAAGNIVNAFGEGPQTAIEKNLDDGFVVPHAAMDVAMQELLRVMPPAIPWDDARHQFPAELLGRQALQHRRLLTLHRLLAGAAGPAAITTVELGPGQMADIAATLLPLGGRYVVKEPRVRVGEAWRDKLDLMQVVGREAVIARVTETECAIAESARMVYCASPSIADGWGNDMIWFTRMTRDVAPNGYLVLQTDAPFEQWLARDGGLQIDVTAWKIVIDRALGREWALPTYQDRGLHFRIFRRK